MSESASTAAETARVTLKVDLLVKASELSNTLEAMLCAVVSAGSALPPDTSQALSDAANAVRAQARLFEDQIHLIPQTGQAR